MTAPHPLAKYLESEGLKLRPFAARCESTAASISRIIRGEQTPSLGLVQRICNATGGKVTPADFFDAPAQSDAA